MICKTDIKTLLEQATEAAKAAAAADYLMDRAYDRAMEMRDWASQAQDAADEIREALESACSDALVPMPDIVVPDDHAHKVWVSCGSDDYGECEHQAYLSEMAKILVSDEEVPDED